MEFANESGQFRLVHRMRFRKAFKLGDHGFSVLVLFKLPFLEVRETLAEGGACLSEYGFGILGSESC